MSISIYRNRKKKLCKIVKCEMKVLSWMNGGWAQMGEIAAWCLNENPVGRPEMREIVALLSQLMTSAVEWEASLGGNSQVFSGLFTGRWFSHPSTSNSIFTPALFFFLFFFCDILWNEGRFIVIKFIEFIFCQLVPKKSHVGLRGRKEGRKEGNKVNWQIWHCGKLAIFVLWK